LQGKLTKQAIVVDPVGAIVISVYIIIAWILQASSEYLLITIIPSDYVQFYEHVCFFSIEQVRNLTGHTAEAPFLQRLTHVVYNYRPDVVSKVDSIQAVHFGTNFFTEVDIGLPGSMPLSEAHDIGIVLQNQLETMDEIERAFVHLDFEFSHMPASEHKIV
jgi:divalent metal cation (Fe/Co/Zn/Cd) transporter